MKKYSFVYLMLKVFIFLLVIDAFAWAKDTYKVGAILPETGWASYVGKSQGRTLEMMVKNINQKGGINQKKIDLIIEDSESDPTKAVLKAKKLIENEVDVIIGPGTARASKAVIQSVYNEKIPLIICSPFVEINPSINRWVFQTAPSFKLRVDRALEHMRSQRIRRLYLYGPSKFDILRSYVATKVKDFGIDLIREVTYDPKQDQKNIIRNYPGNGTSSQEAILYYDLNVRLDREQWGNFFSSRRDSLYILFPEIIEFQKTPKFPSGENVRLILPTFLFPRLLGLDQINQTNEIRSFTVNYRNKFKEPANIFDFATHDALMIVVNALQQGDLRRNQIRGVIRDRIETTQNFVGLTGIFNFSDNDHNGLSSKIFKVETTRENGCADDLQPCNHSDDCGEDPSEC
jgi:branched-chain amino acid transport system substrate-binding protein